MYLSSSHASTNGMVMYNRGGRSFHSSHRIQHMPYLPCPEGINPRAAQQSVPNVTVGTCLNARSFHD